MHGPFQSAVVESPNILESLAGSAVNLYNEANGLLSGKCEVFYAGSVAPPN
jgi:hypothetical protein